MAVETLRGIKEIGGFAVVEMDSDTRQGVTDQDYVVIDHADKTIRFKIQNGPTGEVGINGCQVDTLIHTALMIVEGLDARFPCEENKAAILHLRKATAFLNARTADRQERGVEGKNQS